MEVQFHPASGRDAVRSLGLSAKGERAAIVLAGAIVLLLVSMWVTVPAIAMRSLRAERAGEVFAQSARRSADWDRVRQAALTLRERALASGDRLNRIAFLYDYSAAQWPRALDPDRGLVASEDPERLSEALAFYVRALERGRAGIEALDGRDPDRAREAPSILPVGSTLFQPSALFGPRVSPWTGREEFFPGLEIAAPAGSPVLAAGGGTVVFTGRVRPRPAGWLWRLGNVVVVSHGGRSATLYGHLSKIDVRRGTRVERGQRLGQVGTTGWALSPMLHYQYWRRDGSRLHPSDPLFAILDRPMDAAPVSLTRMAATRLPGAIDELPGLR